MDEPTILRLMALSQLALDDDAKQQLSDDLDSIIGFIEIMNQVPTENVEPLAHAVDLTQTLRPDESFDQVDRESMQMSAPDTQDGFYLVPKVLDQR